VELDTYTFVLLRRGPRPHEFSDEELEEIQAGHLARLTEADPAIRVVRMRVEAMTWLTRKGALE
jgi:hypothetical protein